MSKRCKQCERTVVFKADWRAKGRCSRCSDEPIQKIRRPEDYPTEISINLIWKTGKTFKELRIEMLQILLDAFYGNQFRLSDALKCSDRNFRHFFKNGELKRNSFPFYGDSK